MKNKGLFIFTLLALLAVFTYNKFQLKSNAVAKTKEVFIAKDTSTFSAKIQIKEIKSDDQVIRNGKLEIPTLRSSDNVINHFAYSLSYNEAMEQANWVAYVLTSEETNSKFKRTNKFMIDPLVRTGSADHKDYSRSGFDRGHLAPAGDMAWSSLAMSESFYFSNMSPQDPGFNRGIWKKMEEMARTWAIDNKTIYVVTGPVLSGNLISIGANGVAVPKYYYKVILDYSNPSIKGIGFLVPNVNSKKSIINYTVSIDDVESITGIDFFPLLPDSEEIIIEKTLNTNDWVWKNIKSYESKEKTDASTENAKNSVAVQCSGTTQKGIRCKNRTKNVSGRCYLH